MSWAHACSVLSSSCFAGTFAAKSCATSHVRWCRTFLVKEKIFFRHTSLFKSIQDDDCMSLWGTMCCTLECLHCILRTPMLSGVFDWLQRVRQGMTRGRCWLQVTKPAYSRQGAQMPCPASLLTSVHSIMTSPAKNDILAYHF